ncbi:MAG TPA: hypothetical protein VGK73_29560, partial [Polyangiaceae bacterium]
HGLVYNPGERVEGYTNFLWTALLAGGFLLDFEPARFSTVLSLASLGGCVVVSALLVWRLLPRDAPRAFPLAAFLLAGNYSFASFGTSGLETMAGALCVLIGLERAIARSVIGSSAALVAATLLHPDHGLFYLAMGGTLWSFERRNWRLAARYAAPFVFGFVPYYLVRWWYYGDFFPNTYYAKSGGSFYFSQGTVYLWVSGLAAGAVGSLPLAWVGIQKYKQDVAGRFVLIAVPLYLVYVAKIGGDFMLGRLLVPVLPLLFVMAELGARELLGRPDGLRAALGGLALFVLPSLPGGVVKADEKYLHVADERLFYKVKSFDPLVVESGFDDQARVLERAFEKAPRPPRLGVGCIGIVGYRTNFPIMDNWGLANRSVAHMPVRGRGRPGHEKLATPGHAFEHDVDFSDVEIWPEPYAKLAQFDIGSWPFELVKYDPPLVRALARSQTGRGPTIEHTLRTFSAAGKSPERLACDHWFLERIYFEPASRGPLAASEAERLQTVRESLLGRFGAADASFRELGELYFGAPGLRAGPWKELRRFDFETLDGWKREGKSFESDPQRSDLPGQGRAFGARGAYAGSLEGRLFDRATGSLRSPEFTLEGEAMTLLVSGGLQVEKEEVRLIVEGRVERRATGCDSEVFGRRVWSIAELRGKRAQIEIVDRSKDGWSHLNVDEI